MAADQIVPGLVRTATPLLAGEIIAIAAENGLDIGDRTANAIAFVGAMAFYALARWRELKGSKTASQVLGLGMVRPPEYPPKPVKE